MGGVSGMRNEMGTDLEGESTSYPSLHNLTG
jgi:hypothetical protein